MLYCPTLAVDAFHGREAVHKLDELLSKVHSLEKVVLVTKAVQGSEWLANELQLVRNKVHQTTWAQAARAAKYMEEMLRQDIYIADKLPISPFLYAEDTNIL